MYFQKVLHLCRYLSFYQTRVKYNSGARENQKIEILNSKSSIEKKRQKEANQQKKKIELLHLFIERILIFLNFIVLISKSSCLSKVFALAMWQLFGTLCQVFAVFYEFFHIVIMSNITKDSRIQGIFNLQNVKLLSLQKAKSHLEFLNLPYFMTSECSDFRILDFKISKF